MCIICSYVCTCIYIYPVAILAQAILAEAILPQTLSVIRHRKVIPAWSIAMAQKVGTTALSSSSLAQERRAALQRARGAAIAARSAAGLAERVSKDAVRLVRAAEGLLRTATGVLEATRNVGAASPVAAEVVTAEMGVDDNEQKKACEMKEKKKKLKKKKSTAMNVDAPVFAPGAAALEFNDTWADTVPVAFGPPCAPAAASSQFRSHSGFSVLAPFSSLKNCETSP